MVDARSIVSRQYSAPIDVCFIGALIHVTSIGHT